MIRIEDFQKWCESYTKTVYPEFSNLSTAEARATTVEHIIEELGESVKEMRKYEGRRFRFDPDAHIDNISEELGDVVVLLIKLYSIYGISMEDSLRMVQKKLMKRWEEVKPDENQNSTESST
jgi:NTP pyrophosphatase (non-canonical NTP hydrolase)